MTRIYILLLVVFSAPLGRCMTKNERSKMRETVKDMFHHAFNSYMTYAYPADELMPLNCKGRYRGTEPSRGDVDDILGNFSMTLIDSLDSLVIFGEISKFEEAVKLVINEVDFDNDIVVSTFETNIRVLGGLLGGHVAADVLKNDGLAMEWYSSELLDMAKDIGERLMPAFNTTTGIPYPKVNLMYGVANPKSRTGTESATCTACAGTMIMEFGALSRLTGDPKFETAAHKAMKALWTYRSRSSDLVGTVINIHNGEWVRRDSGVGAGIDSYYEYCLKAYILLGEEDYLKRFNQHYKAVMRYINRDSLFLNVHMNNPNKCSVSYMDSLQAFWPGLQVLKGDLQSAIELHEVFYSVAKRHTFLPEAFTTNFEVHWGQHFLRPELVESTYFLYEATKDPYYLEVGKYIVENLNRYTRVPCGFAAVKDVRTLSHENRMDSFLLSETLKYLYLLFTDKEDLPINLHDFVFTTEAHILPLALSNWNSSSSQQSNTYASENLHDHSCPRSAREGNMLSFAENIRQKTRQIKADSSCPKTKEKPTFVKSKGAAPLLRAEQFIPGNKDHLLILKAMGITVTKTDDGKVQLMQDVGSADNSEMAGEGVTFMQSMIELAKFRSNDAEYLPRIVQILSPPYDGNIVLNAGPAQFGIDLGKSGMGVGAEVVLADPFKGCTELKNKEAADHRIVIMERGDCMFIDKVRVAQSHGAVGVIVIDNNEGSSSESQPMFAMSGDGSSNDINIPAVFLFHNEGQVLQKSMQIVRYNSGGNLRVRLADKALKKDANKDGTSPSTDQTETSKPKETIAEPKPELKQENIQEPTSKPVESKKSEMDKIINIMQNVVNQPGFEFLTGGNTKLNSKPAVMTGEINTADKRERWLYDVMMENWRERERQGKGVESKSGSMEEVVGKFKNGVFSVKARKVSGGKEGGAGSDLVTDSCEAQKTKEEFVNAVVQHHKDDKHEIFIIGNVGDGKSSKEDMMVDITTLEEVVDRGDTSHEESVKGGGHTKAEEGQDEVDDDVIEEKIVSRMDANDALDKDMTEKKQHTGSSVDLRKCSQGGKESQDERVSGNIASHDLTGSSATDIAEPPQGTASDIEADVTKDEIKDDSERHVSKSKTLGEQYTSKDISGNDGDRLLPRTGNHDGTVSRTKSTEDGSGIKRTAETSEGGEVFDTVSHESTEHEDVRLDGENVGSEHEANKNFYIETTKQKTITEEDKILKQGETMSENTHIKSDVKKVEELKLTAGLESGLKYDNVDEKLTLDERTSEEQKQDSIHDSLIEQDLTSKNLRNSDSKESLDNSADRSWETKEKHTPDEL